MWYNSIEYICLVFVMPIDPNHLDETTRENPKSGADIQK